MLSSRIIEYIKGFKYVSFDMFDTLVLRNVCKPTDIFYIVEAELSNIGIIFDSFATKRIEAERKAIEIKDKSNQEITIDEIYNVLLPNDECVREQIKQIEKDTEIKYCTRNSDFEPILRYCNDNGISILITTDMYLDAFTIKQMLEKCNIHYNHLFLSSELKVRKSRGTMYQYILKKLRIDKNQIIHVGDNFKSDFIRPKMMGINSIHYKPIRYPSVKEPVNSVIEALIINENKRVDNIFWKEGYKSLGPLLFGFCQWLHKNIEDGEYDQVLFLSRDGFIMQKAYNLMYPDDESQYVYFSRRSLTVPQLTSVSNFQDIVDTIAYIKREETIETLLHKMGIDDVALAEKLKLKYGDLINRDKLVAGYYKGLYEDIIELVKKNSQQEMELVCKYLSQIVRGKKLAIVDIGWYGTMQHNLMTVMNFLEMKVSVHGYYLGYLGERYKDISANGYIFDEAYPNCICDKNLLFGFNGLIETFFTANHGSVKKYCTKDTTIYPVLEEWEKENWEAVSSIHDGALKFIEDLSELKYVDEVLGEERSWIHMQKLLMNPDREALCLFGNLLFYDTYVEPLNKYKRVSSYLFKPRLFKDDLLRSNWKLGFLKDMFKGVIEPQKIYLLLNKVKG